MSPERDLRKLAAELQRLDNGEVEASVDVDLKAGGTVTGPTVAWIGEGQKREAVIPLNSRVMAGLDMEYRRRRRWWRRFARWLRR